MSETVTIIPPSGSGQLPTVIYDGNKSPLPDGCENGFMPDSQRLFQNTPLVRAASPFIVDRYNQIGVWDFHVAYTFASTMACKDFVGGRKNLPRAGEIMLMERSEGNTFIRYLQGATVQAVRCVLRVGRSCRFAYQVKFTNYSLTP